MKDINHVVITGRIVNLYVINHNPARVIVTIYAHGNNPKIFAANKTAEYIIKNLKVGDTESVSSVFHFFVFLLALNLIQN